MRIIWKSQFAQMFIDNLSQEDLEQYEKTLCQPPVLSLEELRRQGDIQLPLFLKAMGCKCFESMKKFQEESWRVFVSIYGNNIDAYFKDKENSKGNPLYAKELRKLSRRAARKRKCHLHLRGFTCYCDEHQH